jgi:hypothetical protein
VTLAWRRLIRGCSDIRRNSLLGIGLLLKNGVFSSETDTCGASVNIFLMLTPLPTTGSNSLLEHLSAYVPDNCINSLLPAHSGAGRRPSWSSAQLFRITLLALLTPAHSFNLVVELLAEQRSWRRFAGLPNLRRLPAPSSLHEFRCRLGVGVLRQINRHLLLPLLDALPVERKSLGLIDSTDLPAATSGFKKRKPRPTLPLAPARENARENPGRAIGLSATKSTPCERGSLKPRSRYCLCHWSRG